MRILKNSFCFDNCKQCLCIVVAHLVTLIDFDTPLLLFESLGFLNIFWNLVCISLKPSIK